jgi:histidinol dehydrogenase
MRLNRELSGIKNRKLEADAAVEKSVREILADVKMGGDSAVRKYAEMFDSFTGENLLVSDDEIRSAMLGADLDFLALLKRAREQIEAFHKNQIEKSWSVYKENGVMMGQIARPLQRVALYVPGGTAFYPSSVLMNAIPAKLAGVKELAILTPVKESGMVSDSIILAAVTCGVNTIYKIGGAHAVAAAAFGTQTIPKFDKIVGPGNAYVAAAKRLVYGEVDIDMIAGPSEVLIIADHTANPKYVAADLMSQAEHDVMSSAVLITTSETLIKDTELEIERQIGSLSRASIIRESLENHGAAILADNLEAAFAIANDLAPEHLEILTENPIEKLSLVQNAGSIFLGENTPEPLGDYMSGTNHVLPTGGTAKFYSPLGVYDFVKFSSYSYYPRSALEPLKDDVIKFAALEGLDAHANSIKVRFIDE